VLFLHSTERKLANPDLVLNFLRPIICLLLSFKVIANGWVALNADHHAPAACAVAVLSLEDICHSSNLLLLGSRQR
jgi:hypothetical protein